MKNLGLAVTVIILIAAYVWPIQGWIARIFAIWVASVAGVLAIVIARIIVHKWRGYSLSASDDNYHPL
jgi:hypothetical protein